MRKLLLAAAAASSLAARAHAAGRLVLVGGGGTPELARQRCVEGGSGRVLVVTAPTKDPRQSQRDWEAETGMSWSQWKADVADSFARAGASSVEFIDETDPAAAVRQAGAADAIWVPGGDQTLLTRSYPPVLDPGETDPEKLAGHAVAEALRARHAAGASVCGTSAGAAMAGGFMFTGAIDAAGNPVLDRGMGFLDGVIVDSHFTQRLRLPRLLAAARAHPGQVGVGINERAVVEFADGQVRILSGSAQFLRVTGPGPGDYLSFDMIRGETYTIPDGTRVGPAAATSASPLLAAAQTQVRDVLAPFAASQALNDEAAVRAAF